VKGSVVYLFAFDVANEVRTLAVPEVLSARPTPFRMRPASALPRDVQVYQPLLIALPPGERATSVGPLVVHTTVKVFEVGVVSIAFRVSVSVEALADLRPYHALEVEDRPLSALAEELCDRVVAELRPYLVKPTGTRPTPEAYTVFCLQDPVPAGEDVEPWAQAQRPAIAALLAEEEEGRLSAAQVAETTRLWLSYARDDLAVIDWDAALAVDGSGDFDDVLYVMELANLQLEQFRILDDRLDAFALQAYDDLERHYAAGRRLRVPGRMLADLRTIRVDITKMSEEVANITKFVGDWYLARVYIACEERFHLGHWQKSVAAKLQELDDLYSLVRSEIEARRMLLLEATIVALFVLDVVLIVLG
jgi:hypothetical protein